MLRELLYTLLGTGFTCLATVMGAAMVFFFERTCPPIHKKFSWALPPES